jgi:hypothetical protein
MRSVRPTAWLVALAASVAVATVMAQTAPSPEARPRPKEPQWASPAEGSSRYGGEVLEISQQVLGRFAKALAAEEAARQAIVASQAQIKSPAQYDQCKGEVMMSDEGRKLAEDYNAAVNAKPDDLANMQKAATTMTMKLAALTEKTCGSDPSRARQTLGDQLHQAEAAGAKEVGFTTRQFAILKERVVPLCLAEPIAAGRKGIKLPGQGNASYVYTQEEADALRPRCEEFLKLLQPKHP